MLTWTWSNFGHAFNINNGFLYFESNHIDIKVCPNSEWGLHSNSKNSQVGNEGFCKRIITYTWPFGLFLVRQSFEISSIYYIDYFFFPFALLGLERSQSICHHQLCSNRWEGQRQNYSFSIINQGTKIRNRSDDAAIVYWQQRQKPKSLTRQGPKSWLVMA